MEVERRTQRDQCETEIESEDDEDCQRHSADQGEGNPRREVEDGRNDSDGEGSVEARESRLEIIYSGW
jgi:hypothetical protein